MAGADAPCPGSCVLCRQPETLVTYQIWAADGQPRGRQFQSLLEAKLHLITGSLSTVLRQLYRGLRQHLAISDMIGLLRSWHHLPMGLGAET